MTSPSRSRSPNSVTKVKFKPILTVRSSNWNGRPGGRKSYDLTTGGHGCAMHLSNLFPANATAGIYKMAFRLNARPSQFGI